MATQRPVQAPAAQRRGVPAAQARAAQPPRPQLHPSQVGLQHLEDLWLMGMGGFGTEGVAQTTREGSYLGYWPGRGSGFDLSHAPLVERSSPEGLTYTLAAEDRLPYGVEDPVTKAMSTPEGEAYWTPRLAGRSVRSTFDASGGGGDEQFGALQYYLNEAAIRRWLRPRLESFLLGQVRHDPYAGLREYPGAGEGQTVERTIGFLAGLCGCVGRTLFIHLPYLVRHEAKEILQDAAQAGLPLRVRLRLLGFGFGPGPFKGLHPDWLWNWCSALEDLAHLETAGYTGVFSTRTIRSHSIGYDEVYLMDGAWPSGENAKSSERLVYEFAVEAGREVAVRLLPQVGWKLREPLDNPAGDGAGQGTGFLRTLQVKGISSPKRIVRGLLASRQAGRLLDEVERRIAPGGLAP